ncbi:MAG: hypothetical protein ACOCP4_05140 [Candidatus Woesearchaeota archaeon]
MDELIKFFKDFSNPKEKSRKTTSLIILVLFLGFAYVFFDVLIRENGIVSSALLIVLFILIKEIISEKDVLYSGDPNKNKFVNAFQLNLPTKYIIDTFGVNMEEAKRLWYNVFNKWKKEDHEMHPNWQKSLERGFKCRMVYFIIISFRFMFWISLIFTSLIYLINHFNIKFHVDTIDTYFTSHKDLTLPIIYVIICLIVYLTFLIINYPKKDKPKGCFLRFNEINDLNIDWLKRNIKHKNDLINYGKKGNSNA